MGTANFGIAGLDWQQRVNWDRLREYRIERARTMMKKHGLGAMLCMYDENVRYITGTLTPGWNRLKPGLRYAMLCGDGRPILFEQGDLGFQIERHSPWIPKENVRHSFAWIKGAAGPASTQQVNKFTKAVLQAMKDNGVAGQKLGVDFIDINMINIFKENNINWVDGMTPMMEARAVKSVDEQECFRIVGAIGDATHWECMKFLRPGITENEARRKPQCCGPGRVEEQPIPEVERLFGVGRRLLRFRQAASRNERPVFLHGHRVDDLAARPCGAEADSARGRLVAI